MGNICVLLPKEGFFKGFILVMDQWKHLEKEGFFFICSVNQLSELELKCSAPLDSFYYRKDKGIPLFHNSPFRVVCSKSSHFSMLVGKPGSNGTERIPSQLQGFLSKSLGMTNWVAKTAIPSLPLWWDWLPKEPSRKIIFNINNKF